MRRGLVGKLAKGQLPLNLRRLVYGSPRLH
jgi:hypothetical protein